MNRIASLFVLAMGLMGIGGNAYAFDLVEDIGAIASLGDQLSQLKQQYQVMQQQYQQLQQTYQSVAGVRNMAGIANNPALRQYLPPDYQTVLQLGSGAVNGQYASLDGAASAIKQASKIVDITQTSIDPNSATGQAYQNSQNQAATNLALASASFQQSSARISGLQQMLDTVNQAPDEKDILDLQGRIQAEQVMLQNESIRLASLAQLAQAQRDIATQQASEIRLKRTQGTLPSGW